MNMTTVTFNKELYDRAKSSLGYPSDAEVARAAHLDRRTLFNIINDCNKFGPSVWVAWSISKALKVQVLDLFICKYEKDQ